MERIALLSPLLDLLADEFVERLRARADEDLLDVTGTQAVISSGTSDSSAVTTSGTAA